MVESRQEMCQPSSLVHSHSNTTTPQQRFNPFPALCEPPLLALCDDVTFLSPLKVDAGGLSPQPDTPDTPVSPYLASPDEVIATWGGGGARPVA